MTEAASATTDRELVLSRVLDAPRHLVWKVWTDPAHVDQWWGPRGFANTTHEMAVRPGGVWRFDMDSAERGRFPNKITYLEVVEPMRLVYDHGDDERVHFQVIVTFDEEAAGKTLLTKRTIFPTAEERDRTVREVGAIEGGKQTLDRLAEHLAGL